MSAGFPVARPRRLRRTPALRKLVAETSLRPGELVLPVFIKEGIAEPQPISSMPGVVQHTRDSLRKAAAEAAAAGVGGLIVFGVPAVKDGRGSAADDPAGISQLALADLRAEVGDACVIMADLCMCEYTDHGHCGLLTPDGDVSNDATLERYAAIAVAQADAGAHLVAPSGMMDGQVAAIRAALDGAGHGDVGVCAYSAKYASGFYGPFREAAEGAPAFGDRASHQQDPANAVEALREVALDISEGADMVMIKPALAYLDIIRRVADSVTVPVAAYQVSGEFAMVEAAAANGWLDRDRIIFETLTAIRRAGASVILSTLGRVGPDLKAAGVSLANTRGSAIAVVGEAVAAKDRLSWFETKPLFGWRVLVPRTKEQAAVVSQRLREYGAVPEEVPTIAVEPPRTPPQMERAVKGLVTGRYQWVAFTSANAVRAVRERFEEYGLDARAFAGVKVAAVGEQTAASLLDFGIRPDLVPEGDQSAEGLAAVWPPYDDLLDPINRVLLPRADIATETLLARLIDLGWEAEDVTAYRTVRAAPPPAPIREAIKGGGFDAVLFTSSSTVRNLVGIAGKPHAVTVIGVIGPQTAKTAAEFGLRVDVTAPRPSMAALVDALAEFSAGLRDAAQQAGEPVRRPSERRRGARRRLR